MEVNDISPHGPDPAIAGGALPIWLIFSHTDLAHYRLPWGQDRLVPIFLATLAIRQQTPRITFESAAQMLDTFAMQRGGTQYRRLMGAFQRIFGATIFFGTDSQQQRATVVHRARFNFMSEPRFGIQETRNKGCFRGTAKT